MTVAAKEHSVQISFTVRTRSEPRERWAGGMPEAGPGSAVMASGVYKMDSCALLLAFPAAWSVLVGNGNLYHYFSTHKIPIDPT